VGYVEIEVKAKTVDLAVEAAMQELGVEDREQLSVTIVQEPEKGFLGMGGTDAIVTIKQIPPRKRRRDRGKNRSTSGNGGSQQQNNSGGRGGNSDRNRGKKNPNQHDKGREMSRQENEREDDRDVLTIDEQAGIVRDFLAGLVDAYGLEGEVISRVDDDVIVADINGEQTEAFMS